MTNAYTLLPVTADHHAPINQLLDTVFGPGRIVRMAERLREGNHPIEGLNFVALARDESGGESSDELIGAISYWAIFIGDTEALLLGPLVVAPAWQGKGVGRDLMSLTLELAAQAGHRLVMLVGDACYYRASGFEIAPMGWHYPSSVDPERVLIKHLGSDSDAPLSGIIRPRI